MYQFKLLKVLLNAIILIFFSKKKKKNYKSQSLLNIDLLEEKFTNFGSSNPFKVSANFA